MSSAKRYVGEIELRSQSSRCPEMPFCECPSVFFRSYVVELVVVFVVVSAVLVVAVLESVTGVVVDVVT